MEKGFFPGGASLHSMMTPHGPDNNCFEKASNDACLPEKIELSSIAFMFESYLGLQLSPYAQETCEVLDKTYYECWQSLKNNFDLNWEEKNRERNVNVVRMSRFLLRSLMLPIMQMRKKVIKPFSI